MKYIRTKDEIIDVEKDELVREIGRDGSVYYHDGWDYQEKLVVLKESDSIEKLCDELIAVTDDGRHIRLRSRFDLMGSGSYIERTYRIDCPYKVYGAIWTDKGLIYVAKMNEKGELELL